MSLTPNLNPPPAFGSTLPATRNTAVARDPFRSDVSSPRQAFLTPLNFKNTQNTRGQATFCYANDVSIMFSDVGVDTQSFSSVMEIPPRQFYGRIIVAAVLRMLSSFSRRIIRQ